MTRRSRLKCNTPPSIQEERLLSLQIHEYSSPVLLITNYTHTSVNHNRDAGEYASSL